jgi:hypothetical protein
VIVTENGIVQTPTTDYTITGPTLTFTTAPASEQLIQIRELFSGNIAAVNSGTTLTNSVSSINFTGAGVSATNVGDAVTVTINGGGGGGGGNPGQSIMLALIFR